MSRRTTWCVIVPQLGIDGEVPAARPGQSPHPLARFVRSGCAHRFGRKQSGGRGPRRGRRHPHRRSDAGLPLAVAVPMGIADLNRAIAAAGEPRPQPGLRPDRGRGGRPACAQPQDFDDVFTRARTAPRAFVADHRGRGTTVLTTTGPALDPAFGPHSAQRHERSGATSLDVTVRIRFDIDEPTDVTLALAYGGGGDDRGARHTC